MKWDEIAEFTINPAKGNTSLIPQKRNWNICFRGFAFNSVVEVYIGGKKINVEYTYSDETNTINVIINDCSVENDIVVKIFGENSLITNNSSAKARACDIIMHSQIGYAVKSALWKGFCENSNFLYLACPAKEDCEVLSAIEEMQNLTR